MRDSDEIQTHRLGVFQMPREFGVYGELYK